MSLLGPGGAFGALGDLQSAGAALGVTLDDHFQQPFGGGETAQPAANATFDFAGILAGVALESGVGFVELSAQTLALEFDHGGFLLAARAGTAKNVLFAGARS